MKKLLFAAIAICCLLLMLACANEDISSTSQPETSESVSLSENSTVSEDKNISSGAPEASVPDESKPETSTTEESKPEESKPEESKLEESLPEESLPEVFTTKPEERETLTVPEGYEDILSLIDNGSYEQAYELLLQKEYDIYAEKLLERFDTFYKEYKNNYCWFESGNSWEIYVYTFDDQGRPAQFSAYNSPGGNSPWLRDYRYDQKGLLTGFDRDEYTYDENGRLIEAKSIDSDGKITYRIKLSWYGNGLLAKAEYYYASNTGNEPNSAKEYYYDGNGRIIRTDSHQNGKFITVTEYTHGEDGRKATERVTYRSGETTVSTYKYNGNGGKISEIETVNTDGTVEKEYFEYTSEGNLSANYRVAENGKEIFRYGYEYDENGHIRRTTRNDTRHLEEDHETTEYVTDENGNVIRAETKGYNSHNGNVHTITTSGYDEQNNLLWSNSEWVGTDKVWSKATYSGYTVYYNEFLEYLISL